MELFMHAAWSAMHRHARTVSSTVCCMHKHSPFRMKCFLLSAVISTSLFAGQSLGSACFLGALDEGSSIAGTAVQVCAACEKMLCCRSGEATKA